MAHNAIIVHNLCKCVCSFNRMVGMSTAVSVRGDIHGDLAFSADQVIIMLELYYSLLVLLLVSFYRCLAVSVSLEEQVRHC